MAEFEFYGSRFDTKVLLDQILETRQFHIFASFTYHEQKAYELTEVSDESLSVLMRNGQCFLFHKPFDLNSIVYSPNPQHGYTDILQIENGPLLVLALADTYKEKDRLRVSWGNLSYPPYFFSKKPYGSYKPPQELKDAFALLKRVIKKNMVKRYWCWHSSIKAVGLPSSIETLWIGKDAIDLIEKKGYFILWGRNIWISSSDLFINREDC